MKNIKQAILPLFIGCLFSCSSGNAVPSAYQPQYEMVFSDEANGSGFYFATPDAPGYDVSRLRMRFTEEGSDIKVHPSLIRYNAVTHEWHPLAVPLMRPIPSGQTTVYVPWPQALQTLHILHSTRAPDGYEYYTHTYSTLLDTLNPRYLIMPFFNPRPAYQECGISKGLYSISLSPCYAFVGWLALPSRQTPAENAAVLR